jgi:AsmA protein
MKRFLRYLAWGLLALLAVLLIGLGLAAWLIDPNAYKQSIADFASRQSGRPVTLEGDLGLGLFPRLSLVLRQAGVGNPPGFPETPFARVEQARIDLAPWALLWGRIEASGFILEGVEIHLIRRADESNNWQDWGSPSTSSGDGGGSDPLAKLALDGLEIRRATVEWEDADNRHSLRALNLRSGAIRPGQPVAVEVDGNLNDTPFNLRGTLELDIPGGQYRLRQSSLHTTLASEALSLNLAGLEWAAGKLRLEGAQAQALGLHLSAEGQLDLDERQEFHGQVSVAEFTLQDLLRRLGHDPARLPHPLTTALTTRFAGAWDETPRLALADTRLQLGPLRLALPQAALAWKEIMVPAFTLDGPELALRGRAEVILPDQIRGELSGEIHRLRETLGAFGVTLPATRDPAVLQSLAIEALVDGMKINPLRLKLDDTTLNGELSFGALALFTLQADSLNLDRYLPPASTESAKPGELPLEALRELGLRGSVKVGKLQASGVAMENALLSVE